MSSKGRLQRTRAEILDAAWDLVSLKGAKVSIAEISQAAGISRQSVYDHFGSRGGMIMALVRRADERFEIKEKLFAAFKHEDPRQRFEGTIDVWIDFVKEIYPVATDLIRLRATDADAANAWEDRMAELRQWLLVLTKTLEDEGVLPKAWTARTASEFLWASFSVQMWGLLIEDCGWPEARTRKVFRTTLCQTLLVKN